MKRNNDLETHYEAAMSDKKKARKVKSHQEDLPGQWVQIDRKTRVYRVFKE
jgi:hypothetical protein